jgi:chromosome segregation ATPase
MGFGTGVAGHGVGRFNAGKLNNYLHTLNRRLQEENEALLEELRALKEEKDASASSIASETSRRSSLGNVGNRRLSAITALNDVEEDPVAERWLEEKAELEEMVETFKDEVTKYMAEKEEVEAALESEKRERERDKERWKERMAEVEAGVSELVGELEKKLETAEKKAREVSSESEGKVQEFNRQIDDLGAEMDVMTERVEKAERALESDKDLGGALNEANEQLALMTTQLRNANTHVQELEREVAEADSHIDGLEKLHKKDQELLSTLEKDVDASTEQLELEKARVRELEDHIQGSGDEVRDAKAYIEELEENTEAAAERLEVLEAEIVEARNTIKKLEAGKAENNQDVAGLEEELAKAQEANIQMEEALADAEKKMVEDGGAIMNLKSGLAALEREKERVMVNTSRNVSRSAEPSGPSEEDIEVLELELDGAHKEIARLNALLVQSPARRAMEKVKEARIEMLEKEKEELLERNKMLRMTMNDMTPQVINTNGISPIHRHVLSLSLHTPRTPGPPLRDVSIYSSYSLILSLTIALAFVVEFNNERSLCCSSGRRNQSPTERARPC